MQNSYGANFSKINKIITKLFITPEKHFLGNLKTFGKRLEVNLTMTGSVKFIQIDRIY